MMFSFFGEDLCLPRPAAGGINNPGKASCSFWVSGISEFILSSRTCLNPSNSYLHLGSAL